MEIREEAGDCHRMEAREMAGHRRLRKGAKKAESTQNSNSNPLILSIYLRDSTSVDSSLSNLAMKRNPPNELQLDELRPGNFSLEIPFKKGRLSADL